MKNSNGIEYGNTHFRILVRNLNDSFFQDYILRTYELIIRPGQKHQNIFRTVTCLQIMIE